MKICCGTDIIEIERIRESIENEKTGKAFKDRVYTIKEIEYCESKGAQKYQHYAARFAAKEAAFKAISEQIEDKFSIAWKDIEVINNEQGRPILNLIGVNLKDTESIDLSISHCKEYAVANVIFLEV
jgi:holo-[acyl-carrier protein] synthase